MEEVLPLELTHTFKSQIISSQLIANLTNRTFYSCITTFGKMTLVIQHLHSDDLPLISNSKDRPQISKQHYVQLNPKQSFQKRNHFLTQYPFSTFIPVIYEQCILTSHKNRSTCLTLIEPISIITLKDCENSLHLQKEKNLIISLFMIETNNFTLNIDPKLPQTVFLKSQFTHCLHIDFTQLKIYQQNVKSTFFQKSTISELLSELYSKKTSKQIDQKGFNEIILIKDHIYCFSRERLKNRDFKSYFELGICLNFLSDHQVVLKSREQVSTKERMGIGKKISIKSILSLDFKTPIELCHSQFLQISGQFHFYDNYCIDLLQPIQYEQLLSGFFVENSEYVLKKSVYLEVQRLRFNGRQQKGDTIYIKEEVSKSESINFFITYCKFINPTLRKISFQHQKNALIFQFIGKFKVQRKLCLIFHQDYIVKDEQLSMIIEKSKLQNVVIKLSQMQITDSFLMFLANSEKMSKVKELDISYCKRVTQNGVNSLLISPYCKKIEILNVSGTPVIQSSIQSLLSKTKLKQLFMNHSTNQDFPQDTFYLKNIDLIRLQALGMNISPFFSSNISVLKIGIELPFDFLKELKDMPLTELKIKLVEQKKNFIGGFFGTIGNFYSKDINPIKLFAQGRSSKTLRSIDLSGSYAKLKNLKPLFAMPQIQILILEDISTPQEIDFTISPKILQLSLRNSLVSAKELLNLLKNTKILMKLNVALSEIRKQEIRDFITHTKKYINTLIISESQYSPHLIDPNGKVSDYVQTFQILCKKQFFKQKNENLIATIILKTLRGNKNLRLQPLIESMNQKDHRNIQVCNKKFEKAVLKNLRRIIPLEMTESGNNIFINDKPYRTLVLEEGRSYNHNREGINCEQFLKVHYHKSRRQKVYKLVSNRAKFPDLTIQKPNNIELSFDPQNTTLTYFTYLYKKTLIQNPNELIEVSLVNNKIIDCQTALKIITEYNPQKQIKAIDMRRMTLQSPNSLVLVTEIPYLESFNHNQYQIILDEHDFVNLSQKYLKFFMRISPIRKLKLICKNIIEVDILFSIMFHIVDSHYETVQALDCTFQNIKMNTENSLSFWVKISQIRKLSFLKLKFLNCPTTFLKKIFEEHEWNQHKKLQTLVLDGIDWQSLPIVKNDSSIKNLTLNLENSRINETVLIKFLRMFGGSLRKLKLNLNQCDGIIHPNRLFGSLQSFKGLQKLYVSFQYCPIKELSTLDFMENIYSLKKLKQVELDLSFTSIPFSSISNIINNFLNKLPNCHFIIYCLGNQNKQTVYDKEGLLNQGVYVLL